MKPVLTLTMNPTIDIGLEVESLDPTGKSRATRPDNAVGGGGINVARALIELGGDAVAVHTAGAEVGSRLGRLLTEESLEHVAVEVAGETREAVVLYESSSGRTYHVVPPGAELSADEVDTVVDAATARADGHDFLVVSGSLPPGLSADFHARLAAALAENGTRLLLDPSGSELPVSFGGGLYALKLNRREAGRLIDDEIRGLDDARRVNEIIISRRWATIAATTVGEQGAVISTEAIHHEVHTPELPGPVRSDAGAGDSFMAGLTLGLAQGLDVADAGALAVAAASASVLTPGPELCHRDTVEQLRPDVRLEHHEMSRTGGGQQDEDTQLSDGTRPVDPVS